MLNSLKNRIQRITNNEEGSIMTYVIIFMVFFLPFAVWVGVQLPIKYQYTYEIKQTTNNMADSMISRLDETELAKGKVVVKEEEALEVATSMMRAAYNLDENLEPINDGVIKEKLNLHFHWLDGLEEIGSVFDEEEGELVLPDYKLPDECENPEYRNGQPERCEIKPHETDGVHVFVLNGIAEGTQIHFQNIELPIQNTSVIVHANIPVETDGLLGGRTVITRTGISEAEIFLGENE